MKTAVVISATDTYEYLSYDENRDFELQKYFEVSLENLEKKYNVDVHNSQSYTVLKIDFDKKTWEKIVDELQSSKDEIHNIPARFHSEFCALLFNRLNICLFNSEIEEDFRFFNTQKDFASVRLPDYGWVDGYDPWNKLDEEEYISIFIDFNYVSQRFFDYDRSKFVFSVRCNEKEYECSAAELAFRELYIIEKEGCKEYYTNAEVVNCDEKNIEKNGYVYDLSKMTKNEKENAFLSELFEKSISDILSLGEQALPLYTEQNDPKLRIVLTKKLWHDINKELEPQREYFLKNRREYLNEFKKVLYEKLHLTGIIDSYQISDVIMEIPNGGLEGNPEKNILDFDPFQNSETWIYEINLNRVAQSKYNTQHVFDFVVDGQKTSLNSDEVACRAEYILMNYVNPEYLCDVSINVTGISHEYLTYKIGDINNDTYIDITDLSYLARYIVGDYLLTKKQTEACDVDRDGYITLADLAKLRQFISKKITSLAN